jgi:signal transduction histidine kinase
MAALMNPARVATRSLIAKLALFYAALSLLALLLVKSTILLLEFRELVAELEQGALARAVTEAAAELEGQWPAAGGPPAHVALEHALDALLLRLERVPSQRDSESSNVLVELASQPLAARIIAVDGTDLAAAPAAGQWQAETPGHEDPVWSRLAGTTSAELIARADPPDLLRRYAAPLRDRDGAMRGMLLVELRLPLPWRRVLLSGSLEWPILLAYLVVFALGSALFLSRYVTRRLKRIGDAAGSWSRGDFSRAIADGSSDELGRLAHELNRMAAELRELVQTRGRLATLEERQRLARDLHDTVKQKAFALNLQLATATRMLAGAEAGVGMRIEEARRITEEIQRELAQILDELRAPEAAGSLAEQVRARAADFARRSGMAVALELESESGVPASLHEPLLRIVDEALANVLRHSGATRVVVALRREREGLRLSIRDDGRGAAGESGAGMGIRNMRTRAAQLPDGRFELESESGSGTRVAVCWREEPGPA